MKVRYTAKSHICISVKLATGKSQHISFAPVTTGGSYFYTDNIEIQKALESHARYGKLFRKDSSYKEGELPKKTPKKTVAKNQEKKIQEIPVSDLGKAREYLATRFGISRSKLRTKNQILESAKANNISFKGIE